MHQTNTKAQTSSPGYRPSKGDAHEFRAFGNKCDSCSVLGVMDPVLNVCLFVPDKIRRGARVDRVIQLNGSFMRFTDVTGKFTLVNGTFVDAAARAAAEDDVEDDDYA